MLSIRFNYICVAPVQNIGLNSDIRHGTFKYIFAKTSFF